MLTTTQRPPALDQGEDASTVPTMPVPPPDPVTVWERKMAALVIAQQDEERAWLAMPLEGRRRFAAELFPEWVWLDGSERDDLLERRG